MLRVRCAVLPAPSKRREPILLMEGPLFLGRESA